MKGLAGMKTIRFTKKEWEKAQKKKPVKPIQVISEPKIEIVKELKQIRTILEIGIGVKRDTG